MRTRDEILNRIRSLGRPDFMVREAQLEVLLDIRDLIAQSNKLI